MGKQDAPPTASETDKLKDIANSANAMSLPEAPPVAVPVLANDSIEPPIPTADTDASALADSQAAMAQANQQPTSEQLDAWRSDYLEPKRISVGDVFFDRRGLAFRKALSFVDPLAAEHGQAIDLMLGEIANRKESRMPLTITRSELSLLKDNAPDSLTLPTRPIAIDLRTVQYDADDGALINALNASAESSWVPLNEFEEIQKDTAIQIASIKKRISEGEVFHIVTSVKSSQEALMSFTRHHAEENDVEAFANAFSMLYPQLDSFFADFKAPKVIITREPSLYWELKARQLAVKDGKLVILD